MHRRRRLTVAVAAVATVLAAAHGGAATGARALPAHPAASSAAPLRAGRPLTQPVVIRARHGVLRARLVAASRRVQVAGRTLLARTYGAGFVGPTLVLHPGDRVVLTLVNHLREETNLHFHGLHISPGGHADDIFESIAPGHSRRYAFTLPRTAPAGTYWYHSHAMGMGMDGHMAMTSEAQVFDGLSGVLEVRGNGPIDQLPQRVIALKDVQTAGDAIVSHDIDSDAPTTRVVNGELRPVLRISPGQRQLWRIANIGADIFYAVHLDHHRFRVVGQDGQPVEHPWTAGTLVMPPGKRFDVIVTGSALGRADLRTLAFDQGEDHYPGRTLAVLRTSGARDRTATVPSTIAWTPDLRARHVARRRIVVFGEDPVANTFSIDGRSYDPKRIDFHARLGTVEEWTVVNHTEELHPFHMHTYPMQLTAVNGVPQAFDGDQDEVVLPAHGYVTVRIAFQGFAGLTVFHCHILAHEDAGMMANIDVQP